MMLFSVQLNMRRGGWTSEREGVLFFVMSFASAQARDESIAGSWNVGGYQTGPMA